MRVEAWQDARVCNFANVFVPKVGATPPAPVHGYRLEVDAQVHRDFVQHHAKDRGTMLSVVSGGQCLCGFDDWEALHALGREALNANGAPWVSLFFYWANDRYEPTVRVVDPYDPTSVGAVACGEIVVLRPEPPERRRHRSVVRALTAAVGSNVTLSLKDGSTASGSLAAFDEVAETGEIDGRVIVAAQVRSVS